tara:strand:+ start:1258 stop:1698 length:441 start_codon:yes stop_codon:yes gene_type:complete
MTENLKESSKTQEKKNVFTKIKENLDDKEEQLAIVGGFVRLGVLVWSGFILTLNYITIPGWEQNKIDPTFIASVFTGTLSTWGVATAKKRGDGTMKMDKNNATNGVSSLSKADIEKLIEKASQTAPTQILRIEQAPIKIVTETKPK